MENPPEPNNYQTVVTQSLLAGLDMAVIGDERNPDWGWYSGVLFSVEKLPAEVSGLSLFAGENTVAGHLHHLVTCFGFVSDLLEGKSTQPDWAGSWKIRNLSSEDWAKLVDEFRTAYSKLRLQLSSGPTPSEAQLKNVIHNIAHTAYHTAVVRQILKQNNLP